MVVPTRGRVVEHRALGRGGYYLLLEAPQVAATAQPGQFVHLRVSETYDPLLRRPFSLHEVDRAAGRIAVLYRVRGRGTSGLANRQPGEYLDLLGPLGRGFPTPQAGTSALLVGGGTGVAPLYFLATELKRWGVGAHLLLGAATADELWRLSAFEGLGLPLEVATEDGSLGMRGRVTDLLPDRLGSSPTQVFAAGPWPMLRRVADWAAEAGIPAFVSLEQVMACGTGLCLGCAVPVVGGYVRACSEGPVFAAEEVLWDEA
ncbi:MAG: dihydroorotate dehydrogenase electron transfer subunit [Moorellales bacterium]